MAAAFLKDLTYWYPGACTPALDDVSLELDGGLTLVVGPSGGGKSTLLRVFNGLVPHFHGGRIKGSARIADLEVSTTPTRELARTVGFVFQDPELQAVYDTVEREVAFGLENIATPPSQMRARVDDALHEVGVEHLRGRRIATLSGGERQRVALASVLAMRPTLVVFDEPTSQLDPDGAERVLAAVSRVVASGRTVIVAEHRLEPLLPAARAMLMVQRGRIATPTPEASPAAPRDDVSATSPAPAGEEAWSLRGVTAGHPGRAVLDGVDLAGRKGEVVVLRGPNGGGKTTLLRTIAGGLAPLGGKVQRAPGRIAYLPQNPMSLLHRPTVRAEVELTLRWAGEEVDPDEILQALGLMDVAGRYARDLSSGERQRAALAAVLAGRPALALLDEPTRGMDQHARNALVGLVAAMRDRGAAIVLATHDAALAEALASRVLDVGDGGVREATGVRS